MFQDAHDSTIAESRQEFLGHVIRIVEVDEFTVLHDGTDADMGVFATAGNALNRFSLERNFKTIFTEYFTDDDTGLDFVISRLYGIACVFPVDFELFENVNQITGIINLGFDTTDFFMTHFWFEAIETEAFNSLFQSCTDYAVCTLPIRFLQFLCNGKAACCHFLARGLDPEFQFGCRRKYDFFDIVSINGQAFDAVFFDDCQKFIINIIQCVAENGTGIDIARCMTQKAGDTESTNRLACCIIDVAIVIIDEPVYTGVSLDINTGIGKRCNTRQDDGRPICLESRCIEEIIIVIKERRNRNLFICIIAGEIDAYERYEFDFRMLFEQGQYPFFTILTCRNDIN